VPASHRLVPSSVTPSSARPERHHLPV